MSSLLFIFFAAWPTMILIGMAKALFGKSAICIYCKGKIYEIENPTEGAKYAHLKCSLNRDIQLR